MLNQLSMYALEASGAAGFDVVSVMKAAVESVQGNVMSVLGIVVPVAAAVAGAVVAVRFGLKWLRSLGRG